MEQETPRKKSSTGIIAIVIIIILVAIYALAHKPVPMNDMNTGDTMPAGDGAYNGNPASTGPTDTNCSSTDLGATTSVTLPTPTASTTKSFTVTGSNYKFSPSVLSVNKGDTVKITFVNSGGFHDLVVDGYNVHTPQIQDGQSATITFVADKAGTFEYYCSVGNHRQMGMKGTLTVQ